MNLIAAVDQNWAIGNKNELLVRIPADQKFFRETTTGKVIGFIGVVLGAGNAAGGYVVTERMLEMFKTSKKKD